MGVLNARFGYEIPVFPIFRNKNPNKFDDKLIQYADIGRK